MKDNYEPIKSMKEVPVQLRKLRREYVRYQQAELIYSLSHKKNCWSLPAMQARFTALTAPF